MSHHHLTPRSSYLLQNSALALLIVTIIGSFSGCNQESIPAETPTPIQETPCVEVPPYLDPIEQELFSPGAVIQLKGTGGYDQCGSFYNESLKVFKVFFDGDPERVIGSFSCMANMCQGSASLPAELEPGIYSVVIENVSTIQVEIP